LNNVGLKELVLVVAKVLNIEPKEVCVAGKQHQHVQARSLLCFWAVREIGMTETALAKILQVTQPAIAQSVSRGERLAAENRWQLQDLIE
jgi:putative transposase